MFAYLYRKVINDIGFEFRTNSPPAYAERRKTSAVKRCYQGGVGNDERAHPGIQNEIVGSFSINFHLDHGEVMDKFEAELVARTAAFKGHQLPIARKRLHTQQGCEQEEPDVHRRFHHVEGESPI